MRRPYRKLLLFVLMLLVLTTGASEGGGARRGHAVPTNAKLPTISGSSILGTTLSASTGSWIGASITYAYQWKRCDVAGAACSSIAGATANAYGLAAADVGSTIRVSVTASNRNGFQTATSAPTSIVAPPPAPATSAPAPAAPTNTSVPQISGSTAVGAMLATSTGTWSGSPTGYSYQWKRCDSAGGNCTTIAGAGTSSYAVASGDVGATLRAAVTATNSGGTTTALSSATTIVSAPASASPSPVSSRYLAGVVTHMLATTSGVYRWDNPDAYLTRLATAGAGIVRDDCYSGNCDRFLSLAKAHGLKLVLILSGGNLNPAPSTIASFASSLVKYADANYPGTLLAVEPMNEPNIGTFASNPSGYVAMHNAVYDAVHATGTRIKVWCCATSGTGISTWTPGVLNAGVKFDEWSAHPYPAWGFNLGTAASMLDLNRASGWSEMPKLAAMLQNKRGYPGPIHGTEFGAPTNPAGSACNRCESEQVQAELIAQGYAQWKQWPWAGILFVYTGQDDKTSDTTNYENHFGIYRTDNSAKPAVAALKAVVG